MTGAQDHFRPCGVDFRTLHEPASIDLRRRLDPPKTCNKRVTMSHRSVTASRPLPDAEIHRIPIPHNEIRIGHPKAPRLFFRLFRAR